MRKIVEEIFENKKRIIKDLENSGYVDMVNSVAEVMNICISNGFKILLAGNGGSAADAQHFAGELLGRFMMERKSIPAMSLCVDPSVVTCISNDYGYTEVFARQIEGLGQKGDIFVAISTSGNSSNLINALQAARKKEIVTVGLLGGEGGEMKALCDYAIVIPATSTPRIQEIHILTIHILCEMLEYMLFT